MSTTDDRDTLRALTPDDCWDDEIDMPFRWFMPDNARNLSVEVDEDGEVRMSTGFGWTTHAPNGFLADEARWLRDIWGAVLLTVDAYTGVSA